MMIDMHTHVLPGIDDGAKDWDACLRMLSESAKCGVTSVIATPHYSPWNKKTSPEVIRELCKEAEERLQIQCGISIDIFPGHEIYYNVDVLNDLKSGKALALAESRYVLLEFEPTTPYSVICYAVREFTDSSYIPILAHMERYRCLQDRNHVKRLKEAGALFQMNVEAFAGGIFDRESNWAKKCLRSKTVDFLASDMHNLRTRTPMTEEKIRWVREKLEPQYQEKLLWGNGQKIIAGIKQ